MSDAESCSGMQINSNTEVYLTRDIISLVSGKAGEEIVCRTGVGNL